MTENHQKEATKPNNWFERLTAGLNISWDQALHLLSNYPHSPYLRRHRADFIIRRVQLVSAVFAILTPLWTIIDYLSFPWPLWGVLGGLRFLSALVFLLLAWPYEVEKNTRTAFSLLTVMLLLPPVFYLVSLQIFAEGAPLTPLGEISTALYALLPFIVVAGLSLFPLTVIELLLYGLPVLLLSAFGASQSVDFTWAGFVGTVWLAFLVFSAAGFASSSQLRYMITLVSQASQDPLTGAFTRRSGPEIIDLQFRVSARQDMPFTIVFIDLDDFKSINDNYGHDEGDRILVMFISNLKRFLRRSDAIVRWGGEEFLVVLPNTDMEGTKLLIRRIMKHWLGRRPDGRLLTASFGVAERQMDDLGDWPQLVELADKRMYEAKRAGKHRAVFGRFETITGSAPSGQRLLQTEPL